MKVWAVLAAWVACWMVMVEVLEPWCCGMSLATLIENEHKLKIYTVKFNTKGATRDSYLRFMKDLFNALTDHADRSGLIAVLPGPSSLSDSQRYIHVEVTNEVETITFALDVPDVYVLGYQAGEGRSYFFPNVPNGARNIIFPNTQQADLPFAERYGPLEIAAGVNDRRDIALGIEELSNAIHTLYYAQPLNSKHKDTPPAARALLICIQMVTEAVRLRNIQNRILNTIRADGTYDVFHPDAMMQFETNWEVLGSRVQSARAGEFVTALTLEYQREVLATFNTVREVLFILALMKFSCRWNQLQPPQVLLPSSLLVPIRSTLEEVSGDEDTCDVIADYPTVHILGQDGLCVDVYQGRYDNGNSIILFQCAENQVNQLWTIGSVDQTIRSNGKCLTTYDYSPGSYVMIYDCESAASDATKWDIREDGTIINPRSRLVLTAKKDTSSGSISLVVDDNINGASQAWYASSSIAYLSSVKIVGYNNFCLIGRESRIWLDDCAAYPGDTHWSVYPDGTIRKSGHCLEYEHGRTELSLGSCDGYNDERWLFQSDGTILHRLTEKVIDVIDTRATIIEVGLNSHNSEQLTQIWFQD